MNAGIAGDEASCAEPAGNEVKGGARKSLAAACGYLEVVEFGFVVIFPIRAKRAERQHEVLGARRFETIRWRSDNNVL